MSILKHDSLLTDVVHCLGENSSNKWAGLIYAIEEVVKRNPYSSKSEGSSLIKKLMWLEQSTLNFPILYLASLYLYIYATENGCDTFLFATRDGCHFHRIFSKMFPKLNVHYFHCSRKMFEGAVSDGNQSYKDYVLELTKGHMNKAIFIDIHGTAERVFTYFEKTFGSDNVPYCLLLSAGCRGYRNLPSITRKYHDKGKFVNLVFGMRGTTIEMLNYDIVGTLKGYTHEHGPVRDPLEYPLSTAKYYHRCIEFIVEHLLPIEQHTIEKYSRSELNKLIINVCQNLIGKNNQLIITSGSSIGNIKHIKKH